MPVVLVHGNPESAAIWDPLRAELQRDDVIALSPPGFGAPVPEGFGATSDDYVVWLAGELERIGGVIDLVGHDWGGGHVARLAGVRPDLIRSWCTDIAGCFEADYVWHDQALVWQTPGEGEAAVDAFGAIPKADLAAVYESLGMTPTAASSCAEAFNDDMKRCLLSLYRSAVQPRMYEWSRVIESAERRPALAIIPSEDGYTGGVARATAGAQRMGAQVAVLDGLGHWWMQQDPARGAKVLKDFFATLG